MDFIPTPHRRQEFADSSDESIRSEQIKIESLDFKRICARAETTPILGNKGVFEFNFREELRPAQKIPRELRTQRVGRETSRFIAYVFILQVGIPTNGQPGIADSQATAQSVSGGWGKIGRMGGGHLTFTLDSNHSTAKQKSSDSPSASHSSIHSTAQHRTNDLQEIYHSRLMSIRRILIIAFISLSLLPALGLTFLAFSQVRSALSAEIARNLEAQSVSLIEQIDRMLFERFENMRTWRQLDVMQEIRIRDLDKRVSDLLSDLKSGYGVYSHLFCTTPQSEVIAASDPYLIGSRITSRAAWLRVPISDGHITVEPFIFVPPFENLALRLRVPLRDSLSGGKQLGTLHALFDWSAVLNILDQAELQGTEESPGRVAILLDREGQIIAASSLFRQNSPMANSPSFPWQFPPSAMEQRSGAYLTEIAGSERASFLVGFVRSRGIRSFAGFGWSLLVLQPTTVAYRPIWQMGQVFLVLLATTGAIAAGVSLLIAARTARPVVALTEFTRRFMRDGSAAPPSSTGPQEVQELTQAYTRLIHDLDESRDQLVRAAKLAVAGEMAAAMTHEIRTPLGILRSSAQILRREQGLSDEGREMTGFILSETDRLNQLVSSLLSFARPQPPAFVLQDVHTILQQTIVMLAPQAARKDIRLVAEFQESTAAISCDEEQMIQVFLNLVINAFQSIHAGGEVTLRTHMDATHVSVEVRDNGPGVPEEHREHIFEPFFTTRENGVGLGLTVVQQIVHIHHGHVTLRSNDGQGACFVLQFPRNVEERSTPS